MATAVLPVKLAHMRKHAEYDARMASFDKTLKKERR